MQAEGAERDDLGKRERQSRCSGGYRMARACRIVACHYDGVSYEQDRERERKLERCCPR